MFACALLSTTIHIERHAPWRFHLCLQHASMRNKRRHHGCFAKELVQLQGFHVIRSIAIIACFCSMGCEAFARALSSGIACRNCLRPCG